MALIDKEIICAEIERRIKKNEALYPKDQGGYWNDDESCAYDQNKAYNEFLAFLDTLPEQPVEGLEEEIDRFENWMETYNQADYPTSYTTRDIARHFAEWQKGNIKNLLKSWAENELDEHPNKNDDFRLAIYSLLDKLNDL